MSDLGGGRTTDGSRVLVLGDSTTSRELGDVFAQYGWTVIRANDPDSVGPASHPFDVVLIDERQVPAPLHERARARWPGAEVVRLSARTARPHAARPPREDRAVPEGTHARRTGDSPSVPPSVPPTVRRLPHDLGIGRLEPADTSAGASDLPEEKVLRIDATRVPHRALGRLLVGGYITGQDHVVVTAPEDLTTLQREEIQQTAHRLLGMTVVTDRPERMEVQSFLDPAKYGFVPLLNRTVWMLRAQLELCRRALDGTDQDFLPDVEEVEEGVDRLYLLMVRQLMLSCDNPSIARRIEVESRHYQIGDRMVAKMLEVIGDLIHAVGTELAAHREGFQALPPEITRDLAAFFQRFDTFLKRTAESLLRTSPFEANDLLDEIHVSVPTASTLGDELGRKIPDPALAIAAEHVVWSLVLALDMLVVINEVTINRSVEPVSGGGTGAVLRFPGTAQVNRRGSRTDAPDTE